MSNESIVPKQRYEYIDAMRGFVMFFVVWVHVSTFCYKIEDVSLFNYFIKSFRMPLFFFISGYLGYKSFNGFNINDWYVAIFKKFKALIVTTTIVACIYMLYTKETELFFGYWFTYSLFLMFALFYTLSFIRNNVAFNLSNLVVICVFLLVYGYDLEIGLFPDDDCYMLLRNTLLYYPLFCMGLFAKRYNMLFDKMLNSAVFKTILVIAYFSGFMLLDVLLPKFKGVEALSVITLGSTGLLIAYICFKKYYNSFSHEKLLGRAMQHLGRRTLDVYLLHYFFMAPIPFAVNWFSKNQVNSITELLLCSIYAICVICICLTLSKILSVSEVLEKLLFARSARK